MAGKTVETGGIYAPDPHPESVVSIADAEAHRLRMEAPRESMTLDDILRAEAALRAANVPVFDGLYVMTNRQRYYAASVGDGERGPPARGNRIDTRPFDEAHADDPARAVATELGLHAAKPKTSGEHRQGDETKVMKPTRIKRTLMISMAWSKVRLDRLVGSGLAGMTSEPEMVVELDTHPSATLIRTITTEFYAMRSALVLLELWDDAAYERFLEIARKKAAKR